MKFFSLLLVMFSVTSAFAVNHNYDLKLKLSLNGQKPTHMHIVVKEGEIATVTNKNSKGLTFVDVEATDSTDAVVDSIHMKFTVGTIDNKGVKTIISTPQVTAKENVTAEITVGKPEAKVPDLKMSVVVKRVMMK